MANHLSLVNSFQSSEERRAKYALARSLGASRPWAVRMRDWHWEKIGRFYSLETFPHFLPEGG